MACSSCDATSSSAMTPLEASLKEFTSLLGSHFSPSSSSERSGEPPKTRLDLFLSAHDETSTYTLPSLSMFPHAHSSQQAGSSPPSPNLIPCGSRKRTVSGSAVAEQTAIHNLSYPLRYSRSEVVEAPKQIAQSLCSSFTSLIEANLRQYFKLHVLRQSQDNVCGADSARCLAKSFFQESRRNDSIKLLDVDVSFTVPPTSENSANICDSKCTTQERLQLDLHMNITFKMNIGGTTLSVPVEGNGSITGFSGLGNTSSISRIDIAFDTPRLLLALREKARLVAWNAIRTSPSTALPTTKYMNTIGSTKCHRGTTRRNRVISPELTPRKVLIEPEKTTLSDSDASTQHNKKKPESSLPAKKRLCLRNRFSESTDAQSPLDILTGLAVLATMQNQEEK
mmetsp:Transcript_9193/g.13561  ORF Transcript_9193/g.13561 Transcript_9193/m.13561 type:complete len:396 (-) Transcript_9193:112-1299(-)